MELVAYVLIFGLWLLSIFVVFFVVGFVASWVGDKWAHYKWWRANQKAQACNGEVYWDGKWRVR